MRGKGGFRRSEMMGSIPSFGLGSSMWEGMLGNACAAST